jgi:hypothetical protein
MTVYALYNNSDSTLHSVYTTKSSAKEAHFNNQTCGLKTFKHLTKVQVERLSYTEATFFELVMEGA